MPLKTDYKNFIPSTTTKIHDIKQASDGTVINAEVILEDVTIYSQEGDAFGAGDINATNAQVNANTQSISDIGLILGDVTVEQLAMLASVDSDIQDQLDAKSNKTTLATIDDSSTTPTYTLVDNQEKVFSDTAISTIGITIPNTVARGFIASVIWVNPTPTATLTVTNNSGFTLKYKGDGVAANAFTPVVGTTYTMIFTYDGVFMYCYISGV